MNVYVVQYVDCVWQSKELLRIFKDEATAALFCENKNALLASFLGIDDTEIAESSNITAWYQVEKWDVC